MFWFEIGAADYSYGMGFYSATADQMSAFRRKCGRKPRPLSAHRQELMSDGCFITGEEYAKSKGSHDEVIDLWYNRKRIGLEVSRDFGGEALTRSCPAAGGRLREAHAHV